MWSWFSHRIFYHFFRFLVNLHKKSENYFREWLKKNMIWWFNCLLFSVSRIWFRTFHDFRYDDWQLIEWQWNLNSNQFIFVYFLSFYFIYRNRWIDRKKEKIKREKRRNDRIRYIKFRKFFRFFIFISSLYSTFN